MDPITVAQLLLLLIVGLLLFRTQSGNGMQRRGWRGLRRDASIFPAFTGRDAKRREAEWQRERAKRLPLWAICAIFVLVGTLNWWLRH